MDMDVEGYVPSMEVHGLAHGKPWSFSMSTVDVWMDVRGFSMAG